MPRYRNKSSGRVVRYLEPSARLEASDRWETLDEDAAPDPAESASKAAEAAAEAAEHAAAAAEGTSAEDSGTVETREEVEAAAGDNGPSTDTGRAPAPVEQPAEQPAEEKAKASSSSRKPSGKTTTRRRSSGSAS